MFSSMDMSYDNSATTIVCHDAYTRFVARYGEDWRFSFQDIMRCPNMLFHAIEFSDMYPTCHYIGGDKVPHDVLQSMTNVGVEYYPTNYSLRRLTRGEDYVVLFMASEADHRQTTLKLLSRGASVVVYYVDQGQPIVDPNYRSYRLSENSPYTYKAVSQ